MQPGRPVLRSRAGAHLVSGHPRNLAVSRRRCLVAISGDAPAAPATGCRRSPGASPSESGKDESVPRADAPLARVRVLDLTRVLAGPFCAMILGDMGAEVVKVEEPGKGDDTRSWPPFAGGEATYFLAVNRNKQSLTLNLKAPEGRAILQKLVRKSDVLLENFRTGTMERLGLGYKALARLNPRLVYCAISGFGESG